MNGTPAELLSPKKFIREYFCGYACRLPLGVSLGGKQADFRVAPRPEAQSVKPRRAFSVAFEPYKSHGLIPKAPRLDKPQSFGKLGKGRPQKQGAVLVRKLRNRQGTEGVNAHGRIVIFRCALDLAGPVAPRRIGIDDTVFSDSSTSVNAHRILRLKCCLS